MLDLQDSRKGVGLIELNPKVNWILHASLKSFNGLHLDRMISLCSCLPLLSFLAHTS